MTTLEHCVAWVRREIPAELQEQAVTRLMRLYWTDEARWGGYTWREMLDVLNREEV